MTRLAISIPTLHPAPHAKIAMPTLNDAIKNIGAAILGFAAAAFVPPVSICSVALISVLQDNSRDPLSVLGMTLIFFGIIYLVGFAIICALGGPIVLALSLANKLTKPASCVAGAFVGFAPCAAALLNGSSKVGDGSLLDNAAVLAVLCAPMALIGAAGGLVFWKTYRQCAPRRIDRRQIELDREPS